MKKKINILWLVVALFFISCSTRSVYSMAAKFKQWRAQQQLKKSQKQLDTASKQLKELSKKYPAKKVIGQPTALTAAITSSKGPSKVITPKEQTGKLKQRAESKSKSAQEEKPTVGGSA